MSTPRQAIAPNHPSRRGDERMPYLDFLLHTASSPGGSELLLAPYLLAVWTRRLTDLCRLSDVAMQLRTKRVYEGSATTDGRRILVDRLWPRGVTKAKVNIDFWAKAVAPSNELRKWYGHDPDKWDQFRQRYFHELDANADAIAELRTHLGSGMVTLVFSSKEPHLNNASALKEYLESLG